MKHSLECRPLHATDATLIPQSWGARVDNFIYLTSPVLNSIQAAQHYIRQTLHIPENMAYHLVPKGEICGVVKAIVDGHRAQVGYVVDKTYWGRGIATQAVQFITAELKNVPAIQRIWATCALENIGSQRVLEKCGYQREGILKNWAIYPAGGNLAHDNFVYSL